MLDTARHDTQFSRRKDGSGSVAELDSHLSAPNEKQLVLELVVMPRENAGEFDQL